MPSFDLTGRVAIVTGGAQGLGRVMAVTLAQAGADIAVVAHDPEPVTVGRSRPHAPLGPVSDEIAGLGRRVLRITADLRDQAEVSRMVHEVQAAYGRIDILVSRWDNATLGATLPALGRPSTEEEQAGTVVWLASDAASYVTERSSMSMGAADWNYTITSDGAKERSAPHQY